MENGCLSPEDEEIMDVVKAPNTFGMIAALKHGIHKRTESNSSRNNHTDTET